MEMSEQEGVAGKRDGTAVLSLIYTKRGTLFSGYDYDNTQRWKDASLWNVVNIKAENTLGMDLTMSKEKKVTCRFIKNKSISGWSDNRSKAQWHGLIKHTSRAIEDCSRNIFFVVAVIHNLSKGLSLIETRTLSSAWLKCCYVHAHGWTNLL